MKITVTEQRECCQHKDLKPLNGGGPTRGREPVWLFCQHCGRHHRGESEMDAAGSSDWVYKPQPWPWEAKPLVRARGLEDTSGHGENDLRP